MRHTPVSSLNGLLFRLIFAPLFSMAVLFIGLAVYQGWAATEAVFVAQEAHIRSLSDLTRQYLSDSQRAVNTLAQIIAVEESDAQKVSMFQSLRTHYPRFGAVYFLNNAGRIQLVDPLNPQLETLDMSGEEWFRAAMGTLKPSFSEPFMSLSHGNPAVVVYAPVFVEEQVVGTLAAELNLSFLQEIIQQSSQSYERIIYVTNFSGNLIAHSQTQWVAERRNLGNEEIIHKVREEKLAQDVYYDTEQSRWMIANANRLSHGWIIVSASPLFAVMDAALGLVALSLLIFLASILVLRWARARSEEWIIRPMRLLSRHADRLSQGDYEPSAAPAPATFREISSLQQSFERMTFAIQLRDTELQQANDILKSQIEERIQAEEQVRHINSELEQRVRERTAELKAAIQEIEASSYTISHDLRAPLRAIHGYTSILLDDFTSQLPAEVIDYLKKTRVNALLMGEMVDDLLAFLRINRSEIQKQRINLPTLASRAFREAANGEAPDRILQFTCDPPVNCIADPELLRQALYALLSNAIKFTRPREVAQIHFGATKKNGQTIYFVRDNGIGFDMRYSSKLFAIFQHLHPVQQSEGAGVGLALFQRIIQKHGGKVWAESEPEKGATFYFTLE